MTSEKNPLLPSGMEAFPFSPPHTHTHPSYVQPTCRNNLQPQQRSFDRPADRRTSFRAMRGVFQSRLHLLRTPEMMISSGKHEPQSKNMCIKCVRSCGSPPPTLHASILPRGSKKKQKTNPRSHCVKARSTRSTGIQTWGSQHGHCALWFSHADDGLLHGQTLQ